MYRISKILIAITLFLQACWILPWCYNFLFTNSQNTPFTLYSTILDDFVSLNYEEGVGLTRVDQAGNKYTQEEADSLLPFFYVRQLMADQRFPDSIKGQEIIPRKVQISNFTFRSNAYDINAPQIGLHPLLESMSGRVDLKMPDDVFRFTNQGIEFIEMNTNTEKVKKSTLFTQALKNKGFTFPATLLAGDPNPRKEYDEGYLIVDADNKLFHFKQVCGRPFVRSIDKPQAMKIKHLYITEHYDRKTLGYLIDQENKMHVLEAQSYEIKETGIPAFNPFKEDCMIIGNMMDWTICILSDDAEKYYAIDANDYHLIKSLSYPIHNSNFSILSFTSFKNKYVKPHWFNKD